VTPDQLNEANENDNEDDSTPASGGQAVGTPGSDEADASGRVVPTFERVELQDRLVDVVDRSGRTCWRYEDRGATYPGNVPPMIGIVRAFGDRAGEVEVAVRACPDDAAAQDAAEHLVNQAVIDDDAARTQVPGLDGAVGVTLACPAPALTCDSQATAYVVRDQRLVSVDVDSADIATAATVLRSQLDQL
jgi:hypothetical protein